MRRICSLLVAAAFAFGVVGCGETAPATPKKPDVTAPKKTDTPKKDEKKDEPVKTVEPAKKDDEKK